MLSPLRVKCLCLPTFVMMKRSPAGAPIRPPSPLPGMRTREPVSTPAGILTFTVSAFGTVPLPLHKAHGGRRLPVPPQSGHSCANLRRPPAFCTWPAPWQVGQVTGLPPVSPAPLQREHCSERLTVMFVVSPVTPSSNESASGISMSAPFCGIGRGGSFSAFPPPNSSEKMSRNEEPPPVEEEVVVLPQSKPVKSKGTPPPRAPAPPPGPDAPRAAASASWSEYDPKRS